MSPHLVAQWFRDYNVALRKYLVHCTRMDFADAEDILTKVWIRVIRHVKENKVHHPMQLLRKMAMNEASEFFSRSRQCRCHDEINELARTHDDLGATPEQFVEYRDGCWIALRDASSATVMNAVDSLPQRQRRAIVMHHFDEMKNQAVADAIGLTRRQVERDLALARSTLRRVLQSESERDHGRERNHSKPAPRDAAGHLKGLHAKQDHGSDEQNEIKSDHGRKRPAMTHVPGEIVT